MECLVSTSGLSDWLRGLHRYRNYTATPRHNATKYGNNSCFRNNICAGNKAYIAREIKVARQDNITHDGTCPGRTTGGDRTYSHTHTPTTLTVQLYYYITYNWWTPSVHRVNTGPTQSLRKIYAAATQDLLRAVTALRP